MMNDILPSDDRVETESLTIRRVVDGRSYDTETAEFVGWIKYRNNGFGDFLNEQTGLYRTPKKQWFIAGEGGAASRWSHVASDGRSRIAGEGLELISSEAAQKLMEENGLAVESYFDVEEG